MPNPSFFKILLKILLIWLNLLSSGDRLSINWLKDGVSFCVITFHDCLTVKKRVPFLLFFSYCPLQVESLNKMRSVNELIKSSEARTKEKAELLQMMQKVLQQESYTDALSCFISPLSPSFKLKNLRWGSIYSTHQCPHCLKAAIFSCIPEVMFPCTLQPVATSSGCQATANG